MSVLDPRTPQPAAEIIVTPKAKIAAPWVFVAGMAGEIIEAIAQRVSDLVIEKMDARKQNEDPTL
jgi:hypothetical protein